MYKQTEQRTVSWRVTALVALGAGATGSVMAFALTVLVGLPSWMTARDAASADINAAREEPSSVAAVDSSTVSNLARTDDDPITAALSDAASERTQISRSVIGMNRRGDDFDRRLDSLVERLERTESVLSDINSFAADGAPAVIDEAAENAYLPRGDDNSNTLPGSRADRGERAALIAAGVDAQRVDEIGQRRDRFQLARLDLIDQASREGWRESDRFVEQMSELRDQQPNLRSELGDEAYDRYLFEQGGANRVGIAAVIEGSAASLAGLLPGDVIVSYGNERVFRGRELQSATRAGSRGESVQLSVQRGDEIMAVDMPRGPLGVTLDSIRLVPD